MAAERLALMGERLSHSLSVPIHRAILRALGVPGDYRLRELPAEDFEARARALMAEVDGFNVTIPYKRRIMPLLDGLSPVAAEIGAVNTAVRAETGWIGHNTDAAGFASMLRANGMDPAGRACWVLGTGGASAAAVFALRSMGAAGVTLVSRTPREDAVGYDRFAAEARGFVVNATPAGMFGREERCPLTEAQLARVLPRLTGVADLIYNPPETVLTAAAKRAGIPACTGLHMLVAQAVEAQRLWQGREIPDSLIPAIMKEVASPL